MKKVLAIHTSKRKMNTYKVLLEIQEQLTKQNIKMEIVSLYDYQILDCIGCERCVITDTCVLKDDIEIIKEKIKEADGLIISSPVYLRQVSGKLKTFVDRTCVWFHRPVLSGKPVLAVSTTKGSGLKSTLSYIQEITEQWGGMEAGKIGRNIRNIETKVETKEVEIFIKLLDKPETYRPTMANLMNFQVQKALANTVLVQDKQYWDENGWNTQSYYSKCKVNPIKNIIPSTVGKIITRAMKNK